eukprot:3256197-Pyramimonas_sp.AAC.1
MPDVVIRVAVQPSPTDVTVVDFVGLTCGRQDRLPKRGNGLYICAKERLLTISGAQRGSVPLNRIQTAEHLVVMLGGGTK